MGPASPPDGVATGTYEGKETMLGNGTRTWRIRGYVFRGNHRTDYGGSKPCLGSEFSVDEVQRIEFRGRSRPDPQDPAGDELRAGAGRDVLGSTHNSSACPGSVWGRLRKPARSMCGRSSRFPPPSRTSSYLNAGGRSLKRTKQTNGMVRMKRLIHSTRLSRYLSRSQRGQSIVLLAFAFIALIAFVGLVTDISLLFVRYSALRRGRRRRHCRGRSDPRGHGLWRSCHRRAAVHRAAWP